MMYSVWTGSGYGTVAPGTTLTEHRHMPIYEYECRGCGNRFEKIIYGKAEAQCPSCSSVDLSRLLSTFAVSTAAGRAATSEPVACSTCGDPRGSGACSMN
jgi:putative FmdB family regulatory protein